ncbi:MAG: polysaccharide pyruvyl transferase family protein [Pseudomonadota bacterium]
MGGVTRPTIAILGTAGRVRAPERFEPDQLLRVLGANAGNLVFQYAVAQLFDADTRHIGAADIPYDDRSALSGAQCLVVPAANHLRLGADWTGFCHYLERCGLPLVVLGLGAQAPAGGERQTLAALKADPQVARLAGVIRDRAVFVSVRGPFSRHVCEAFGIDEPLVLGCPSALLNPDPHLGRAMASQLKTVMHAVRDGDAPPFALAAAAPFEIAAQADMRDFERVLFAALGKTGGLYVQQSGGVDSVLCAKGPDRRVPERTREAIRSILAPHIAPDAFWQVLSRHGRFFVSAAQWIAAMEGVAFAVGTRLHGTMAAVAAGRPGIVVTHDSRTGELAQTMRLPTVSLDDVGRAQGLSDILSAVRFDGAAFDVWRQRTARALTDALEQIGLPVSAPIHALSGTGPRHG